MKIKKLKIKLNKDNEYSDYRYFIPKSNNIKMTDGRDVDEAVQSLKDKIANLKEQANYLINKAPLVKYAEGASIILTDCAEAPLRKLTIEGNSKQETREGYNKFNSDNLIGITPTSIGTSYIINEFDIDESGIYTIVSNLEFYYNFKDSNDNTIMNGNTSSGIAKITITDDNINTIQKMMIFINEGSLNKVWTKLMLLKGEYTLNNSPEYEQYGASPSIEHEAPIESVGDNINLFDGIFNKHDIANDTGIEQSFESANHLLTANYIEVKSNTDYTLSFDHIFSANTGITKIMEFDKNHNFITRNSASSKTNIITFKTSGNCHYIRVGIFDAGGISETKLKIKKGTSTGAYSPYGQGSIEIYNGNKNLFDKNNAKILNGYLYNGKIVSSDSTNTIIIVPIKANTTYTISKILQASTSKNRLSLGTTTDYPVARTNLNVTKINADGTTKTSETITSGNNDNYLVAQIYTSDTTTLEEMLNSIQLEKGETATEYIPHQSQTKALYTQQPFRAIGDVKDRFVKVDGVWYEEHNVKRLILNGTENWGLDTTKEITQVYKYYNPSLFPQNQVTILSNCFIDKVPGDNEGITVGYGQCYVAINKSTASTPDEFKAKLTELYDAGTPVYVDYVLVTPTLIPCTLEQVEVLDSLQSYDRITYYNVDKINNVQANMKLIYKQDINAILEEKGV